MKTLKLFTALVLAVIISVSSAHADFPKIPVMERFTGVNCGPCAKYNAEGYDTFASSYSGTLTIITYFLQVGQSPQDPFYYFNIELNGGRATYCGVNTVPSVIIDGVNKGTPSSTALESTVDSILATRSPMQITPTITLDADNNATVNVEVLSETEMENVTLQVMILEAAKHYTTAPGSNGEKDFYYIARYALPNATGETFSIGANETKTFTRSQAIDISKIDKKELYVIAFVQNNTSKAIIQSGTSTNFEPMILSVTQDDVYNKVVPGTAIQHSMQLKNTSNIPVDVTLTPFSVPDDWSYSVEAPTTISLAVGETKTIDYSVLYSGTTVSLSENGYLLTLKESEEKPNTFYSAVDSKTFHIDITNNVKYAYLYDGKLSGYNSYVTNLESWTKATYFENSLMPIPMVSFDLFTSNILDGLEFVGLTIDDNNKFSLVNYGKNYIFPKLTSLMNNNTKVYFSAGLQFAIANDAGNKQYYPTECQAIIDFYKNQFAVVNTVSPYYIPLLNGTTLSSMTINGVTDDPISNGKSYIVNSAYSQSYPCYAPYSDFYQIDNVNTTSTVFNGQSGISAAPVIMKYQDATDNAKNRRVLSGFDFQGLPPANKDELTNNIVDWLFADGSIEDGETNLSTKNGVKLAASPNPMLTTSHLVITNENDMDTYAKVYLLDVSGKKVYDIFDGTLTIGANNFDLNANNISAGKYFLVAETATGKTFMSIVINK